jgi:hypothetical protein
VGAQEKSFCFQPGLLCIFFCFLSPVGCRLLVFTVGCICQLAVFCCQVLAVYCLLLVPCCRVSVVECWLLIICVCFFPLSVPTSASNTVIVTLSKFSSCRINGQTGDLRDDDWLSANTNVYFHK